MLLVEAQRRLIVDRNFKQYGVAAGGGTTLAPSSRRRSAASAVVRPNSTAGIICPTP